MNRLALYVFWERNGNVHDHVAYYLKGLLEVARDVTVIVNGTLSEQGKTRLEELGVDFFVRENRGIDFAAWQEALARTGWEKLSLYDELILCNSSCYGPVYPFSGMFRAMEGRECDFWGINRQPNLPEKLIGPKEARFPLKGHIQSYFYVFRKTAMLSRAFQDWWREMVPAESYWDEVRLHELEFSGFLEAHGLVGATCMDFEKYNALAPESDACNLCADIQLEEDRNPLVKRKLFLRTSPVPLRVLRFLREQTSYPVEYILADMARSMSHSLTALIKYTIFARITFGRRRTHYAVKAEKVRILRDYCGRRQNGEKV